MSSSKGICQGTSQRSNTNKIRNFWFLILVCLVASLGGLLFGFDTAVISGTVSKVEEQFSLSKLLVGWFTSSALVGCIAGALVAGSLGDRFGRKRILIIAAVMFFVSAAGSMLPPSFPVLIVARIIGGIGVGMASVLAPLYISEFSPPHLRGRLVAMYQLSIVVGILLAYYSNWILQKYAIANNALADSTNIFHWVMISEVWRGMFGAEMIPAGLFILLLFFVPESPRWLITKGRDIAGLKILSRISGEFKARQELNQIRLSVASEEDSIRELFKPGLFIALLVGVGLSFFGQLSGVNIVIYYGPTILENAGFEVSGALQYQVALGFINLIFTIVALFLIDRFGRRFLLVGGMACVAFTLAIAGVLFSMKQDVGIWLVVVLGSYMAFVAVSICSVIWVLTPEIFPNRIRGRAMSIATLTNWATNSISAYLFPWYVTTLGINIGFFTFAFICLIATLFFWRFVPETKGRSLEEIEMYWLSLDKSDHQKPTINDIDSKT